MLKRPCFPISPPPPTTPKTANLQVGRLRQWQQQPSLNKPSGAAAATAAAPQLLQPPLKRLLPAHTQLLPQEYGSNLDIRVLEGPAALSWFLPAAASNSSRQQQHAAAMAAAAAGVGAAATPAELRQVFAAEAAGDDLGWGGGVNKQGSDSEEGLDVDIDSDDEKRGKGKKVRLFCVFVC